MVNKTTIHILIMIYLYILIYDCKLLFYIALIRFE